MKSVKRATRANTLIASVVALFSFLLYLTVNIFSPLPDRESVNFFFVNSSNFLLNPAIPPLQKPFLAILSLFGFVQYPDIFYALLASLTMSLAYRLLIQLEVSSSSSFLLLFCSYYPLVLVLDSQRAALSSVFLLLSIFQVFSRRYEPHLRRNKFFPFITSFVSVLIHFQTVFLFMPFILGKVSYFISVLVESINTLRAKLLPLLFFFFSGLLFFILIPFVTNKFVFYQIYGQSAGLSIASVFGSLLMIATATYFADNKIVSCTSLSFPFIVGLVLNWLGRANTLVFFLMVWFIASSSQPPRVKSIILLTISFVFFFYKELPFFLSIASSCNPYSGC